MKNVFDILRQKEHQLNLLEEEVNALRLAARLITDEDDGTTSTSEKELSQPQMVQAVLREKGKPLHVKEIVKKIKEKYNKKMKATSLTAVIYRYIKRGKFFCKVGGRPNTFGLIEWQPPRLVVNKEAV